METTILNSAHFSFLSDAYREQVIAQPAVATETATSANVTGVVEKDRIGEAC